ncbi:MAG TPA: PPOX class F420-dependent oxidoreductase [Pseudonocardiaceae bacterium]|jgi:pyridoxamine 5'-phosphate oxidase family protein|nr:PPOX class F420-dependent oxidoreductase [Pseudonocardiaceae bacterium]
MSFTQDELDYLAEQHLGRLATQQQDGTLQVNPVGFSYNKELGTIDIGGFNMTRSRKYRNVAANGRAAFVVDDIVSVNPWRVRCLEIRGTAEVVEDPDPLIRLTPNHLISFGLDKADVEPHKMVANIRDV